MRPLRAPLAAGLIVLLSLSTLAAPAEKGNAYDKFRKRRYSNEGLMRQEDEIRLAAQFHEELQLQNQFVTDRRVVDYVNRVGRAVAARSRRPDLEYQFYVVDDLNKAKEVAEERARKNRMMSLAERQSITRENLLQAVADQKKKTIDLILKADVQGSLQALTQQLEHLTHEEVTVRLVHSAIGAVTESDVSLAIPSNAVVLAFRVGVHDKGRVLADRSGIEIRPYEVIYELLDDVRAMMEGSLAPEMTEEVTGHAEVRAVFKSSRLGNIAGCYITDGSIFRDSKVRVLRNGKVLHTGAVASLKREKDDAREVREGFECGIGVANFNDLKVGDVIEAYKVVAVKRLLKI